MRSGHASDHEIDADLVRVNHNDRTVAELERVSCPHDWHHSVDRPHRRHHP